MAERDGDFLTRWSRRKRGEPAPGDPETETADSPSGPPSARARAVSRQPDDAGETVDSDAGDPEVIAKLPDIDSMEESADFTAFLQAGVPEALRRRALRRLWRLNPVFAVLDGLNDYDEDFTAGGIIAENIKTIYKVGKGYLDDDDEDEPGDKPEDEAGDEVVEERPAESAEPGDPVEMAQVSQADPEATQVSPVDGDADSAPSRPVRGSALARRWGGSPEEV